MIYKLIYLFQIPVNVPTIQNVMKCQFSRPDGYVALITSNGNDISLSGNSRDSPGDVRCGRCIDPTELVVPKQRHAEFIYHGEKSTS